MTTTYKKTQLSMSGWKTNRQAKLAAAYQAEGLSTDPGGYPVNPTGQEAYVAGFQRGLHGAFLAACKGRPLDSIEAGDATCAGQGEVDGCNRGAQVLLGV